VIISGSMKKCRLILSRANLIFNNKATGGFFYETGNNRERG
jgi:hypothetical protein